MGSELSGKWRKVTLGEIIDLKYGFGLPERTRKGGNIPVYGSSGIVGWHDEATVKGPGITVGRKGTIGSVYQCKSDFWPIDTTYFVELRDTLDLHFVYYLLKVQDFTYLNSDSAVPGLNRNAAYGV
jgi:type I restriction enzyme S subunit